MTPSTERRIARLYERIVGYDPYEDGDGQTPAEALETLRWFRTALTLNDGDPTAYTGPTLNGPTLRKVSALRREADRLESDNLTRPWVSWSDMIQAKHLRSRAGMLMAGFI